MPIRRMGEHLLNHFGIGTDLMSYTGDGPVSLFIATFAITGGVRYEADGLSLSVRGGLAFMITSVSYDAEALGGVDPGSDMTFDVAGTISADLRFSYFFVGGETLIRSGSTEILRLGLAF
jgi:hypothetical protein